MAQYEIKKCDITIECGATFTMHFVVRDNNNSLVDLTGSTVEAQLREYAEANDYFEFTATHNGSGGRVTLTMPFEDTAAIPYTSGVYDVYITDQNNDREKYLIGDVDIVPAVTKPVAGEIIYLLSFSSEDDFPSYGMVRRLYFSHATNHMYRWNGTDYVDIVTDGEAATVEVGDVETLPAGSDATVENVGSLLNAVFNFGIPEGNGIASIEKTGTDVLTDTYTVTFTDPSAEAFDFDVTNGKGIVSIAEVVSGLTHTFTVTYNDGDTFTYTLTDGNGIVSVEKTGATDNVDHYRITFDDGTYFDYDVTNVDTSEFYDKDEVDDLLADKADVGDSYTKDEEDALLADKADSADLGDLASKDTVDWDTDIDDIPETFPPSTHNHDDRYYTETEMDALLADKADTDDLGTMSAEDADDYYTKTETNDALLDKAPVILSNASGSIASFTDGSASPVTALTVGIEPVQEGTGDPSPGTPITLPVFERGTINGSGNLENSSTRVRTSDFFIANGSNYRIEFDADKVATVLVYSPSGPYLSGESITSWTASPISLTITNGRKVKIVLAYSDNSNIVPADVTKCNVLEGYNVRPITGHTACNIYHEAEYDPTANPKVTIDLDGTIYGGILYVLTGTMTVTHFLETMNGEEAWTLLNTDKTRNTFRRYLSHYYSVPSLSQLTSLCKTNSIPLSNSSETSVPDANRITCRTNQSTNLSVFYVFTTKDIASLTDFQSMLSTTPLQLYAPLATPFTVQLSPSQMQTLLGQNNIWADTGDTSVEYRADTKLFVQGQIAETLDAVKKAKQIITDVTTEMVAPRNLAGGDYVIVGDDLLKTTATVASGSTLTIGINCAKTTVAEALIALATASE